jgi:hypothetical protein
MIYTPITDSLTLTFQLARMQEGQLAVFRKSETMADDTVHHTAYVTCKKHTDLAEEREWMDMIKDWSVWTFDFIEAGTTHHKCRSCDMDILISPNLE